MTNQDISLLLGAGFSANKGYPTASKLNTLLLECTGDEFSFSSAGNLVTRTDGKKPTTHNTYTIAFDLLKELFQHFNSKKGYFDYEEFYDYLVTDLKTDDEAEKIADKYIGFYNDNLSQVYHPLKVILNLLISYYVKDSDNKRYYDNEPYPMGVFQEGYSGIMQVLSRYSEKNILNIHTLNHDLLFESFSNSTIFKSISDGFDELGSPYYGELQKDNNVFKCRLSRYTGKYQGNVRLYKLHGSFDYVLFHKSDGSLGIPDNYLKSRYGIGFTNLFKEIKINGKLIYQEDWTNYHSDFLTGTTSKILRYKEPILFDKIFKLFKQNLRKSKKVIIVGYGGRDEEINSILLKSHNYKKFATTIIDPYPTKPLLDLSKKLEAKIVKKNLDDIKIKDIK